MAIGYYFTVKRNKESIIYTGIRPVHPSGICLYAASNQEEHNADAQNAALQHAIQNMVTIIARLHECDQTDMLDNLIVFEVEYDEKDVAVENNNYIIINTCEIPPDKIKYIGKFDTLDVKLM